MKRGRTTKRMLSMMVAATVTVAAGANAALAYMSEAERYWNRKPNRHEWPGSAEEYDASIIDTLRGVARYNDCSRECSNEPRCEAWTHNRSIWGSTTCYLLNDPFSPGQYEPYYSYSGITYSGVKIPDHVSMSYRHSNQWIPYNFLSGIFGGPPDENFLRSFTTYTPTPCENECAIDPDCTGWNYMREIGETTASCILLKTEEIETQNWPRGTWGIEAICGYKE